MEAGTLSFFVQASGGRERGAVARQVDVSLQEHGESEGTAKGRAEERMSVANNLIDMSLSVEQIAMATKLSEE